MENDALNTDISDLTTRFVVAKKNFYEIKGELVKKIVNTGDADAVSALRKLFINHEIESADFKYFLNKCSDEILMLFLENTYDLDFALQCVKFIGRVENLIKIHDDKYEYIRHYSPKAEDKFLDFLKTMMQAVASKLVIHNDWFVNYDQMGKNKFVVGIHKGTHNIHIAWSNTNDHSYHKTIFYDIGRDSFPKEMRSGGYLKVLNGEDDVLNVVLYGSSADFGYYNHKILRKFKKEIIERLSEQLKRKVYLDIEVSE